MHIPFVDDSAVSSVSNFVRFTIDSAPPLVVAEVKPVALLLSFDESIFRFVNICVLVTVCDDVRLTSVADGMVFSIVSATVFVIVFVVATLLSHIIDDLETNFLSEIDSLDDCDKSDTVNADTVDAELSILLIGPLSVSKMNDESSDGVAEFG